MRRNTQRVRCGGGLLPKQDTPVKRAPRGRERPRRLLLRKIPDVLLEEPEAANRRVSAAKTMNPKTSNIQPVHRKSALPAFSERPRDAAVLPAAPANKTSSYQVSPAGLPAIQMVPDPEAFKRHCEIVMNDGERNSPLQGKQSLALISESAIFSSVDSDTCNSEDCGGDDDEDCFSLASSSSSSIPSPEIFRRESNAEMETFLFKPEHLDLHPNIRNSTLLDESQAQSIHMHQPPNLSAIIDASTILAEKCEIRGPEVQIKTDSLRSGKLKHATSAQPLRKMPLLYKKKVSFKSPIIADVFEVKHSPAARCTVHHTADLVQTSSPDEHKKPAEETSRAGVVTSKRPVSSSPEKAKFFDFVSDNKEAVFFQLMRERSVKLRFAPLFPLTSKHTVATAL